MNKSQKNSNNIRMMDISPKNETHREAVAKASVTMTRDTLDIILNDELPKGDVLTAARIAGITAAKKTADLIPLCHPIPITYVEISLTPVPELPGVEIVSTVRTKAATGVEMEALTAVAVAGLTIYDMCKQVDRDITIGNIRLMKKSGGKSGEYIRKDDRP